MKTLLDIFAGGIMLIALFIDQIGVKGDFSDRDRIVLFVIALLLYLAGEYLGNIKGKK